MEGRKKGRETSMCKRYVIGCLSQACAWTGNWTGDLLVCRQALSLLSHTIQGCILLYLNYTSNSWFLKQKQNTSITQKKWVSHTNTPKTGLYLNRRKSFYHQIWWEKLGEILVVHVQKTRTTKKDILGVTGRI